MLFGTVLWQTGVYNTESPAIYNRCSGFGKLGCFDASIIYDSNSNKLSTAFANNAGIGIKITNVKVSGDCTSGSFETMEFLSPNQRHEFFCTGINKKVGESFLVDVEITYIEKVADKTITRTERGIIMGTVE